MNPPRVIIGRILRAAIAERARHWSGTWTVYILRRRGVMRWAITFGGLAEVASTFTDSAVELEARSKGDAEHAALALTW